MNNRKKVFLFAFLFFVGVTVLSQVSSIPHSTREDKDSNSHIYELEKLIKKQNQTKTITAQIKIDPNHPNIINIDSGYFLNKLLAKVDEIPQSAEPVFKKWVLKNQSWLPAPIFIELGRREVESNPEDALKWGWVGRIRSTYDSERCIDTKSQYSPVLLMHPRQQTMKDYYRQHPDQDIQAAQEALQWDKTHDYHASPVWVCAYSLSATHIKDHKPQPVAVKRLLKPESDWLQARIDSRNLTEHWLYLENLKQKTLKDDKANALSKSQ